MKDTFEVAGVRTTAGAPTFANHVPARDAAVVERTFVAATRLSILIVPLAAQAGSRHRS